MDDTDRALLALLKANAREPVVSLARKLGLSRSTVRDRVRRLERRQIINGYTVTLHDRYREGRIRAHVMLSLDPKRADGAIVELRKNPSVEALFAVSGPYDLIALIGGESPRRVDELLDWIGKLDGVEKTMSSIILSTKFDRS